VSTLLAIIIGALLLVPAIVIAIPVHEMGHAAAAYLLGDKSVRYFGYFTLDPRRYLEPTGVLAAFLVLVGWGKRVPVQSNRIATRTQKVLFELGGPAASFIAGLLFGLLSQLLLRAGNYSFRPGLGLLALAIYVIAFLNLSIMAFQLLPIPGVDGWNIIEALLRDRFPRFFFDVHTRRREIWAGLFLILILFSLVNRVNLLNPVMSPVFQPASLISTGTCIGYGIPQVNYLFPCLL
jgi:Zn-dependent protease